MIELIDSFFFDDFGSQFVVVCVFFVVDCFFYFDTFRGELVEVILGVIVGYFGVWGVFGVVVVFVGSVGGLGGEFDGSELVELFSFDGLWWVFYEVDGMFIIFGDLLSMGGELRVKFDFVGVDGVFMLMLGFSAFFGIFVVVLYVVVVVGLLLEIV